MIPEIKIERAGYDDLDKILEIEARSFSLPWSRELFIKELENDFACVYTAKDPSTGEVLGYFCCSLIIDELHILNIAVDVPHRGKKIATRMIDFCLGEAKDKGARAAYLEVRVSHEIARNIYKKVGFVEIGIRRKYYSDNGEDAIVMVKYIN